LADRIPVFVGITTLPSRICLMRPALESLLEGSMAPDRIFLSLPEKALRDSGPYIIPEYFSEPPFSEKLEIIRTPEDYGPGTKLLGMLEKITQPCYVVLADDDVTYKKFFLRRLIEHQRRDHQSCFSFFTYSLGGLCVGQGVDGFSFWSPNLDGIFDFFRQHIAGRDVMFHDDVWISYFMMSRSIAVKSLRALLEEAGVDEVRNEVLHHVKALVLETGRLSRKNLILSVIGLFHQAKVPDAVFRKMLAPTSFGSCICGSGKPLAECHGAPG
jgi:hypothetical protein